jgi:hypothetical protein
LNAEQRAARGELAAKRRHHGDQAELSDEAAELERAANDRLIHEVEARRPRFTPEQIAVLRRVFRYGPPAEGGATG